MQQHRHPGGIYGPGNVPYPHFHVFRAVLTGNAHFVRVALDRTAAVTAAGGPNAVAAVAARNPAGLTPLHLAALLGDADTSDLLIREGSDLRATDINGDSPLHLAAANAQWRTVQLLARCGANVDQPNPQDSNKTPLRAAVAGGHYAAAQVLLQYGASVNAVGEDGGTVLHAAAQTVGAGAVMILHLLLLPQWNANVNAVDAYGMTPLAAAIDSQHSPAKMQTVLNLLLARGSNPLIGVGSEYSALERAAILLQSETALHLIAFTGAACAAGAADAAVAASALALAAYKAACAEIDHDDQIRKVHDVVRRLMGAAAARNSAAAWDTVYGLGFQDWYVQYVVRIMQGQQVAAAAA